MSASDLPQLLARLAVFPCWVIYIANAEPLQDPKWIGLGTGMDERVNALAKWNGSIYAGGFFTNAGGVPVNRIAKWDGTNWSALGTGISGPAPFPGIVNAIAGVGTNLYVGGYFTSAGGIAAINIARWNGSNWQPVGLGVNDAVLALAASGDTLYVGGVFSSAGGTPANRIAKWDGSNWSPLGSGIAGGLEPSVQALTISGTNLYAGGVFTLAGGNPAANIAWWNGNNWSALGSGVSGGDFGTSVRALVDAGSELIYAAGEFRMAGIIAANNIARWNGNSWSAVGSGVDNFEAPFIRALALKGNFLYAGGGFNTAGGLAVENIARWNGVNWRAMGIGIGEINALLIDNNTLYAAGGFVGAGGPPSSYQGVAQFEIPPLVFAPQSLSISNGIFQSLLSGQEGEDIVLDGTANLFTWNPVATNTLPAGGWPISLPVGTNQHQLYRARYGP